MNTFDVKLLRRSIGQKKVHQSVKPLYSDRTWATDLDIVNELGGHTGCVNALSWSTGGDLLASGSDDTYLNIWDYNPSSIAQPFTLNTSVSTGHRANIFSVKFMPHSGDRTVVTCAGDSEVRVFDLEHSGTNHSGGDTTASTRSRRFNNFFRNAKWLNDSNTNSRVYRSHSDRAKRIVTESSPYFFLTCSEDGEVRQWDLRQPSSAYPPPLGARRLGRFRMMNQSDDASADVPPPLISYKKYDLDLNSISCSSSQPHYIALGGAHLHCFLHDRRMLGRDIAEERGQPSGKRPVPGTQTDESMREATKCVRRFAPNKQRRMRPHNTGHITACKISDARPNELIASWSGDHIYSFDIVRSPDARDAESRRERAYQETRLRNRSERKRKRAAKAEATSSSLEGHKALRVRHGNGDTEDLLASQDSEAAALLARDALLTEAQRQAERVATSLVKLRKTLFDFSARIHEDQAAEMETSSELTPYTSNFSDVLCQAVVLLSEMEEIMSDWSYPVNPSLEEVELQKTLRKNRQSAWRFVQAAGVLSKTMGGRLRTLGPVGRFKVEPFNMIRPAPREKITDESRFYYDFMKSILLWLEGGANAVFDGFKKSPSRTEELNARFVFDEGDNVQEMHGKLQTILHSLADEDKPILDLDANEFLVEEERSIFQTQQQGVNSFFRALVNIELRLHQGLSEPGIYSSGATRRVMDKGAAARFWGVKVCRSLLMDAADGVDFAFVQQAFGGSQLHVLSDSESPDEGDNLLEAALEILTASTNSASDSASPAVTAPETAEMEDDVEMTPPPTSVLAATVEDADEGEEEASIILEEIEEENEDDNSDEDDESEDSDIDTHHGYHRTRLSYGRPRRRATVNLDVPYSSHTKTYKGHCNTRTVKDVNYYGLDDEYVVSGSDDGHFFIWDRKTCEIVNILEGDGEVVNVVQGHPYEPMIACSGIDSTIKIFGPGGNSRERYRAANGIDIANPGGSVHSTLRWLGRTQRAATDNDDEWSPAQGQAESGDESRADSDIDKDEPTVKSGLRSRKAIRRHYEITSQNDADRQRGIEDTYITEGMLARFAAALQRGEIQGITGPGLGATGGTIVVDQDNCSVM